MFRKHPLPPYCSPASLLFSLGVILLLSPAAHGVLYASPSASPPLASPYTTATSLFNHVIRHDLPSSVSSASFRLTGPPPTVASPPSHHAIFTQQQQPQHHSTIGNNLRYLTRSSPGHRSHLAAIYAPAPNRPAALASPPPPPHYHSPIQYQPGNGAYRVGPSFGPSAAYTTSANRAPFSGLFDLPPLTGHLAAVADLSYIVEGRLLKQYLVMEDHDDDNTLHEFYNDPVNRNAYVPYLPHLNFGQRERERERPNLGFPAGLRGPPVRFQQLQQQQQPPSVAQFAQLQQQQQQRQPTYALGSGSLGFVRHPSGAIYLGSGSLGYINDQQQTDHVQNLRNRQTPGPGPLSFGHTPK